MNDWTTGLLAKYTESGSPVGTTEVRAHNAHVHLPPNYSAFPSVEDACNRAADAGLALLGTSNYYDFTVYDRFAQVAIDRGLFPLLGIEVMGLDRDAKAAGRRFNDPANPGKVYLCGKGIARSKPYGENATETLKKLRTNDALRMIQMSVRIGQVLHRAGVDVILEALSIRQGVADRSGVDITTVFLQERHVANAYGCALRAYAKKKGQTFQSLLTHVLQTDVPEDEHLIPPVVQNLVRSHLIKAGKPAFVEESFSPAKDAVHLIEELGGIVSYPVLGDGAPQVSEFEADPKTLAANAKQISALGCEFIPSRNSVAFLEEYVPALREQGLIVTAGTEHNTAAMVPVGLTAKDADELPEHIQQIFWEGACVCAAHQVLASNHKPGHANDGTLNEARIQKLAQMGAGLISHVNQNVEVAS